ncbi:MAG: polysaccharide pyruvyl transferase family protein [Lachnospiraceae bacterium]|nr:polysaccharide pyruvyl transferase family protein [Lachnospiraceae bacterium]
MKSLNKEKVVLYAHAGSGNHGCEALANTLCNLIDNQVVLVTNSVEEDQSYSLKDLVKSKKLGIVPEKNIRANKLAHIFYYGYRKLTGDRESFLRYRFRNVLRDNSCEWNLSIGGDNYCYDSMVNDMILSNSMFCHNGGKTALVGCSIEPELLQREDVRKDMERYSAIFARESITYEALKETSIQTKLFLIPDSAFSLAKKELPLPAGFQPGNTVGINISPMIIDSEKEAGITLKNYKKLVQYILDTTDMSVALLPHVVWDRNDDRRAIAKLYEGFESNERVVVIGDHSCEELKGFISRCRFFIGARTHATIAAYSTQVPTLVVGYSVKAKGIAKDLFGTYENYVLPVQDLKEEGQLIQSFNWLQENEMKMKEQYAKCMQEYIDRAKSLAEAFNEVMR